MKLLADSSLPFVTDYFAECTKLQLKPGRDLTSADLQDVDALLVRSVTKVDEQLLANTPVKFVGSVTAGADHLDMDYLQKAGITCQLASGFNAPPVADYVTCVIAGLQKKNLLTQKKMRAAVIGVGHVGKRVVERLQDLSCELILCDPLRAQNESNFFSTPLSELEDLDLLTLHVPLIKTGEYPTWHFMDKQFLQKQKPGCVIVNTSRGGVIDTQALLNAGGHLRWCLDVFENEPCIDKVILERATIATPHIAGYSVQSKMRGMEIMFQALLEKKMISTSARKSPHMPLQQISLANKELFSWQDVVLHVFDPLAVTTQMKQSLLFATDVESVFDEMRHGFYKRFELAYTEILHARVSNQDKQLLEKWGMRIR